LIVDSPSCPALASRTAKFSKNPCHSPPSSGKNQSRIRPALFSLEAGRHTGGPNYADDSSSQGSDNSGGYRRILSSVTFAGEFQPPVNYQVNPSPTGVVTGDFNRDRDPDLAIANPCGTDLTCVSEGGIGIMLGNGDGTFQAGTDYMVGQTPISVAIGNFNTDSFPDLAVADQNSAAISVLLNSGLGQ
jgi:hypothetical protein